MLLGEYDGPVVFWLLAVKTLSYGKTIFLRLYFLCCNRKKILKLVSLFIFRHFQKHYFWNTQNQSKWPGNRKFRVWKSRFPWKSSFPYNRTSWDKYLLNDIPRHKFQDMCQLVRLEGTHTAQTAHCAVGPFVLLCTFYVKVKTHWPQSSELQKVKVYMDKWFKFYLLKKRKNEGTRQNQLNKACIW